MFQRLQEVYEPVGFLMPDQDMAGSRPVLILDDNDANRMLLKIPFEMYGIPHVEADCGDAALKTWQPGGFSFAFLDIELPDISGLEVARRIRQADPYIGIVMCSTNDDPETLRSAVEAGCDMFLVKPFNLDTLFALARRLDVSESRSRQTVVIIENTGRQRDLIRSGRPQ